MSDLTNNSSTLPDPSSPEAFGLTDSNLGLPSSDGTSANPLVSVPDPTPSTPSGFLSTVESYASSAVTGAESAASSVFSGAVSAGGAVINGAESAVKTGYSAGKTVIGDVTSGVEGVVGFGVNQVVLVIAAVGIALYFVGKTGAFKVTGVV